MEENHRIQNSDDEAEQMPGPSTVRSRPAQEAMEKKIVKLYKELAKTKKRKRSLLADGTEKKKIRQLKKEIKLWERKLDLKEKQRQYSLKYRNKKKLEQIASGSADSLRRPGRPRLEEQQPELLKTITELALFGASAEERRRCEVVRTIHTLSDLTKELNARGFKISRSATYLRLLPRRANTREGKRHVVTVPVKLRRPEADLHRPHQDQHFCVSSIRSLETIASILGPEKVTFLSQDDKARVPIGITAASKQAPLLMHVEYKVSLPDHDFVVASGHKLIPSVYALCEVAPSDMGRPEAVSYSGPTYIAIRSGKHSSSTATSHAEDLQTLFTTECFAKFIRYRDTVKPVLIISSDGGPDENPRYRKVIAHAIDNFKRYDLDALFIVTNAPGRSAFNRVERRMAPLSRELSGVVLPHDSYGTHLDAKGRTVDVNLEKENFKKAGTILAEIWSKVCIDGYAVVAQYIDPDNDPSSLPDLPDEEWYSQHVRESQYLLQVVKCDDLQCCSPRRSVLHKIMQDRFLPPPYPIIQADSDPTIPDYKEHDGKSFASFLLRQSLPFIRPQNPFIIMPYDLYCPSVRNELEKRCCSTCGIYFASFRRVAEHRRAVHKEPENRSRVRPSRIVAKRDNEVLCANTSGSQLEWLEQEEVEGADDFLECHVDDLVPIVSIETVNDNPWDESD